MKVDIRRKGQDPLVVEVDDDIAGAVFITINGRVYYIDDSTNEQIVSRWPEKEAPITPDATPLDTE